MISSGLDLFFDLTGGLAGTSRDVRNAALRVLLALSEAMPKAGTASTPKPRSGQRGCMAQAGAHFILYSLIKLNGIDYFLSRPTRIQAACLASKALDFIETCLRRQTRALGRRGDAWSHEKDGP